MPFGLFTRKANKNTRTELDKLRDKILSSGDPIMIQKLSDFTSALSQYLMKAVELNGKPFSSVTVKELELYKVLVSRVKSSGGDLYKSIVQYMARNNKKVQFKNEELDEVLKKTANVTTAPMTAMVMRQLSKQRTNGGGCPCSKGLIVGGKANRKTKKTKKIKKTTYGSRRTKISVKRRQTKKLRK
jgi:hypothetical protein